MSLIRRVATNQLNRRYATEFFQTTRGLKATAKIKRRYATDSWAQQIAVA